MIIGLVMERVLPPPGAEHRPQVGNGAVDVMPITPSKAGSMLTKQPSFTNWMPEVAPVDETDAGSVTIDISGPFAAGSYQRFTLTYTSAATASTTPAR